MSAIRSKHCELLSMQNNVVAVLLISFAAYGGTAANVHATEFQTFTLADDGFEVRLPVGKIESRVRIEGESRTHMYGVEAPNVGYFVAVSALSLPSGESLESRYKRLERLRAKLLEQDDVKLLGDKRITLAGIHPGIHYRGRAKHLESGKDVLTRSNYYLVGERLIILTAVGLEPNCDGRDADEFLHSLTLLNRKVFSNDPKRFVSPDGKFQVPFPFEPKSETTPNGTRYFAETVRGTYEVVVSDMPNLAEASYAERRQKLDAAVKDILDKQFAKVVEQVDVKHSNRYDGYAVRLKFLPGIDSADRGILRARLYVVGGRLYEISVRGAAADADDKFANYFLDSFAVKP